MILITMNLKEKQIELEVYIKIIMQELDTLSLVYTVSKDAIDLIAYNLTSASWLIEDVKHYATISYSAEQIEELKLLANTLTDPDIEIDQEDLESTYSQDEITYLQIIAREDMLCYLDDRLEELRSKPDLVYTEEPKIEIKKGKTTIKKGRK